VAAWHGDAPLIIWPEDGDPTVTPRDISEIAVVAAWVDRVAPRARILEGSLSSPIAAGLGPGRQPAGVTPPR
jgi:hypothetical protein